MKKYKIICYFMALILLLPNVTTYGAEYTTNQIDTNTKYSIEELQELAEEEFPELCQSQSLVQQSKLINVGTTQKTVVSEESKKISDTETLTATTYSDRSVRFTFAVDEITNSISGEKHNIDIYVYSYFYQGMIYVHGLEFKVAKNGYSSIINVGNTLGSMSDVTTSMKRKTESASAPARVCYLAYFQESLWDSYTLVTADVLVSDGDYVINVY